MQTFQIPLLNVPQYFNINIAGVLYRVTSKWNDAFEAGWVIDFQNPDTNEYIASNIPLVAGTNILSGLEYLNFNCIMYIYTDGNQNSVPTLLNLGIESNLYFDTEVSNNV